MVNTPSLCPYRIDTLAPCPADPSRESRLKTCSRRRPVASVANPPLKCTKTRHSLHRAQKFAAGVEPFWGGGAAFCYLFDEPPQQVTESELEISGTKIYLCYQPGPNFSPAGSESRQPPPFPITSKTLPPARTKVDEPQECLLEADCEPHHDAQDNVAADRGLRNDPVRRDGSCAGGCWLGQGNLPPTPSPFGRRDYHIKKYRRTIMKNLHASQGLFFQPMFVLIQWILMGVWPAGWSPLGVGHSF